jgi:amidophosphoribosyltransferase
MVPMLIGMTERGPDSAGLAVFGNPLAESQRKISVYSGLTEDGADFNWLGLAHELKAHLGVPVEHQHQGQPRHPRLRRGPDHRQALDRRAPPQAAHPLHRPQHRPLQGHRHAGRGGRPLRLLKLTGSHLVGHTRMATESAVTPDRAHPFTAGEDFCLVHNGSLSNPNGIRRMLEPRGITFETDNDTEAACRFLEWRLREGDDLETALQKGFEELDGFFTFLMGTPDKLALIRDPFACKPAVVAETDDYVAIASEFRSLAHLPGIKHATVFEPAPEEMYVWNA